MTVKKDADGKFPIKTLAELVSAFTAPVRRLTNARVIASGDLIVGVLKSGRLFSNVVDVSRHLTTHLNHGYAHQKLVRLLLKAGLIAPAASKEYFNDVVGADDRNWRLYDLKELERFNKRYSLGLSRRQMQRVKTAPRRDETRELYAKK